ncbi:fibrillin-1-like [Paramacrobiotus metropolitanus]|uniref:fibrillin-1-like n=1 Tax=Paramacrobiotus metropolitanus TaxID=2943436 RepID=UPI002445A9CE|nr:fibrillin-1-like [Paramacrobiotus metropolitanus]
MLTWTMSEFGRLIRMLMSIRYENTLGGCIPIKQCAITNPTPGQCQDVTASYSCICPKGWMVQNGACVEINQCIPVNPCGRGTCRKSPGSYTCDCLAGYTFVNGQCIDVDECAAPANPCVTGNCVNTEGSYSCVCPKGFFLNQKFCEDRNECVEFLGDLCPDGGTCVNTPESYRCTSPPNFDWIEGKCANLNTCEYVGCGALALPCANSIDGPVCRCPPGYYGDGRMACKAVCSDGMENDLMKEICVSSGLPQRRRTDETVCGHTGMQGQSESMCTWKLCRNEWRIVLTVRHSVFNINECMTEPNLCLNGRCIDTVGSYTCECNKGYKVSFQPNGQTICVGTCFYMS